MNDDWHDIYVGLRDPSEYKPALTLAGSWEKWQKIRKKHSTIIDMWAEEVEALLASEAIEAMKAHAQQPGGTAAAKWLAEKSYKAKNSVGRPKKEEEKVNPQTERIAEDAKRLFVVNGGK